MTDYTTIGVSTELKDELDKHKDYPEQSYENLLWELMDENKVARDPLNLNQAEEIATHLEESLSVNHVQLDSTEYNKIADEIERRLR